MTENIDKIIDKALGVVEEEKKQSKKQVVIPRPKENDDVDADYQYQRENFYALIERGQDAVEGILELAQESDHPRAYEVAGQLIKHVGDVADKLMALQKDKKNVKEESVKTQVTNNSLFVGSTADLQKMLKQASKKKDK